jgi:hypothetical protein
MNRFEANFTHMPYFLSSPIIGDICHSWHLINFLHASYDVNIRQHFESNFNGKRSLKGDCLLLQETCILKVYKNKF